MVTAACLANIGHELIAVDIDADKISALKSGKIPIYEPGLENVLMPALESGKLRFSTDLSEGVTESDIIFISVGTPADENGSADMMAVRAVAAEIAKSINKYKVIVNKSTMPVGSTKLVERIILENIAVAHEFDVVSNPEFLREGSAIDDFLNPNRIVIGANSQRAVGLMTELYAPIKAPLLITDPASAEMIKYASNCFLATKVSFINAVANICETVGADVKEVALGMGYDKRIGFDFLKAGPGFGGSCFPKDCKAMLSIAKDNGYEFKLLNGVLEVNSRQRLIVTESIDKMLGTESRIGVLGLAFKPNTDDMRDAPSVDIIADLQTKGHQIAAFDPASMDNAKKIMRDVEFVNDPYEAAKGSDIVILLTEWEEFRWLDWHKVKGLLNRPIIFDTRNCLDPQTLRSLGFTYKGIGR